MGKARMRERRPSKPAERVKTETFHHWLKHQRDRTDAIGDLARSILAGSGDLPANTRAAYQARLRELRSTGAQLSALEEAWRAYEQTRARTVVRVIHR